MTTQLPKIVGNSVFSDSEKQFFLTNGYTNKFSLADRSSVIKLQQTIERSSPKLRSLMAKSTAHLFFPEVFRVATEPGILDNVAALLGKDVLLWMGQVIAKPPGDAPKIWHVDKVNRAVDGIHVSLAVTDMTVENGCLHVIPGTHKYQDDLEEYANAGECDLFDAESMVRLADRLHPEFAPHRVVPVEVKAGEYFLTKGGLWHGVTANQTNKLRLALVIRYMRPDIDSEKITTPGLSSILVRGEDNYQLNAKYQPCLSKLHAIYNRSLPRQRALIKKLNFFNSKST